VGQRNLTIFKSVKLAAPEDEMAGTMSFVRLIDAVAVAMEQWSAQQRALIVETFLKMVTVVKTQRIFRKHFNTARHGKVPCRNILQIWVEHFRTSASALKKRSSDSVRAVPSPQNIEAKKSCACSAIATEH
jgi:hypothetical protein